MFKKIAVFTIYLFPLCYFAQDFSALWKGYFSFYNIKDVVQGINKIYAASENAIFSYDIQTNNIKEITTINGLSGEQISTIYYSETYQLLMIGYENGLIEIVFDNDDDVLTVVDVINKATIPPTNKRINHFNAYSNIVYVATNYGISVFNLDKLEFGDTYFIGNLGSQTKVSQTTIFNDYIYAACLDGNGLQKALISNPNLIDYQNWQTVTKGDFLAVETAENKLYAINTNKRLYNVINDALNELVLYNNLPIDIKFVNDYLVVTTTNDVFVYDSNFNVVHEVGLDEDYNTTYSASTLVSDNLYIGTKDFGVLKTTLLTPITFEEIHPDGPLRNNVFSVQASYGSVWASFGDYTIYYNPSPIRAYGVSHLENKQWVNIPYNNLLNSRNLNTTAINPLNPNQVFISSFQDGLLEVENNKAVIKYDQTNSGLESLDLPSNPNYISLRLSGLVFDNAGLLWSITSLLNKPLKSYNPSTKEWRSYSFTNIINDPIYDNLGFNNIVIDNLGTKFISSFSKGVIGFNENNGSPLLKNISEEANLPDKSVRTVALDKTNQLWIGTHKGLRVLYNTSNFFSDDNVQANDIIILEDGIPKELLFEQFISNIEVDESNNKWIGTVGSGLFYLSYDGQKTIYHFTKDNSPLPSNDIQDISIDNLTGNVFIATNKGLVSFHTGSSNAQETLKNAYAYPNPVRPNFNIVDEKIKIKDVSENVNVKITDIEGNLVAEAQSKTNLRYNNYNLEIDGGTVYWNGKNLANNIVSSGVYLIMLSDLNTFETRVLKLMVIR